MRPILKRSNEYQKIKSLVGTCPRFSPEEEIELVNRMQLGDESAKSALMQSQMPLILNLTVNLCQRYFKGRYLYDLFMDAVEHVRLNIHKFVPFHSKTAAYHRLSSFVGTIVKNKIIDLRRKRRHNPYPTNEQVLAEHPEESGNGEPHLIQHHDVNLLFSIAVQEIARYYLDVDELIAFQSLAAEETLALMVEKHGRSKSYWHRKRDDTKKRLRKLLLDHELLF